MGVIRPGTDCPVRLYNSYLQRYWKFDWTRSWLPALKISFEQEDALGNWLRSLPAYTFLRLYMCKGCVSWGASTMGWLWTPSNGGREEEELHQMKLSRVHFRNLPENKRKWLGRVLVHAHKCGFLICCWFLYFCILDVFICTLINAAFL